MQQWTEIRRRVFGVDYLGSDKQASGMSRVFDSLGHTPEDAHACRATWLSSEQATRLEGRALCANHSSDPPSTAGLICSPEPK